MDALVIWTYIVVYEVIIHINDLPILLNVIAYYIYVIMRLEMDTKPSVVLEGV